MKRLFKRHRKRIPTEFSAGKFTFSGVSTSLSEKGLFIRTQHGFKVGVMVDIKIYLSEQGISILKGVVRYARKKLFLKHQNGMGIEIIENDSNYVNFIKGLKENTGC